MKTKKQTCIICKKQFEGYENNARPFKEGICCNECNQSTVIPSRLARLREQNIKVGLLTKKAK